MDDYSFGAIVSFAGMFFLMGIDFALGNNGVFEKNIAFLIPMNFMMLLGAYCGFKWMIAKRKIEKAS